jgi:hypothetical protein
MDFKKKLIKQINKHKKIEILVGVFFVIFTILLVMSNYVEDDSIKVYDLTGNINFESNQVFYSGTYNTQNTSEMQNIFNVFILNYGNYLEDGKMPYLLVGNNNKMNYASYRELNELCTCNTEIGEENGKCSEIVVKAECKLVVPKIELFNKVEGNKKEGNVVIQVKDQEYHFKLNSYENFYFIIWKEDK